MGRYWLQIFFNILVLVSTRSGARARHEHLEEALQWTPRRSRRLMKTGSQEEEQQTPRKLVFEDDDGSQASQTATDSPPVSSQEEASAVSSQASVNEEEKSNEELFEKENEKDGNKQLIEEEGSPDEQSSDEEEEEKPLVEHNSANNEERNVIVLPSGETSDEDIFDDENSVDSENEAPLEVSSKKIIGVTGNNTEEKTLFEIIQEKKREVESEKQKKAVTRRLKRKKVSADTFNVKTKRAEFTVVSLEKKMTTKLVPSSNFKAELLKNRTAGRRFQNGSANWTHRAKWAGNKL